MCVCVRARVCVHAHDEYFVSVPTPPPQQRVVDMLRRAPRVSSCHAGRSPMRSVWEREGRRGVKAGKRVKERSPLCVRSCTLCVSCVRAYVLACMDVWP